MSFLYLGLLAFSLAGLAMIDWRFKLAFFHQPLRAAITVAACTGLFLIWDATGIALGIFFTGQSDQITGLMIAPEMPIEEPVFLVLLCYTTLIIFRSFEKRGETK